MRLVFHADTIFVSSARAPEIAIIAWRRRPRCSASMDRALQLVHGFTLVEQRVNFASIVWDGQVVT
jgi:hypothetical protein